MPKRKTISKIEFAKIIELYKWAPVKLLKKQYLEIFKNIPEEKIIMMAASGDFAEPIEEMLNGKRISGIVGGVDVVRWDKKDCKIGYPFNKDHYVILKSGSREILVIEGPLKDSEHWLTELPKRLRHADVLEVIGKEKNIAK
jgi:hypothetical protein